MAIRQVEQAPNVGPVTRTLVEVTDDAGNETTDWEVSCESLECERYACTHLTAEEAIEEQREHARIVHDIGIGR